MHDAREGALYKIQWFVFFARLQKRKEILNGEVSPGSVYNG